MKTDETKKNRPRLNRVKASLPNFRITDRDREILKLIYEHRFLDSELLIRLLAVSPDLSAPREKGADGKERPKSYGFGQQALYKRLQLLYHSGYLQRYPIEDKSLGRGSGTPRIAYGLWFRSAQVLCDKISVTTQEVRKIAESNKVKAAYVTHSLEIATLRVLIELACQESAGRARLLFWQQGRILHDWVEGENEDGEVERFTVYPDAFFGIEVQGKGKAHYFLEADRGTMAIVRNTNRPDIRKKILGFWYYRREKKHSRRYFHKKLADGRVIGLHVNDQDDQPISDDDPSYSAVTGFRVLFLAPGNTEGLAPTGRIANMLGVLLSLNSIMPGTSLFWFAPPSAFSLDHPNSVFAKVWVTSGASRERESLIE